MATLTTATSGFSKTVTDLIVRQVLDNLRAGLPHLPAEVAVLASHVKGTNGTFRFVAYPDLAPNTATLPEGIPFDIDNAKSLAIEYDDFQVAQKGDVVRSSDLALVESPHDLVAQMIDKASRQALESIDTIARTVWNTGVPGETVIRPTGATDRLTTTGTMVMNGALIRAAAAVLAGKNVRRVGGASDVEQGQVGGSYVAIMHPHAVSDLQADTADGGWIDASRYADPKRLLTNEVGQVHGVRIISSTRGTIAADTGAGGTVDVYRSIVAGAQAIAWADPTSLVAAFIPPAPSKDDPLGQVALASWKCWVGGVLTDAGAPGGRYVAIETSASLGANV